MKTILEQLLENGYLIEKEENGTIFLKKGYVNKLWTSIFYGKTQYSKIEYRNLTAKEDAKEFIAIELINPVGIVYRGVVNSFEFLNNIIESTLWSEEI